MKAYGGGVAVISLILDLGIRWRWVVNFTPGRFTLEEKPITNCIGSKMAGPDSQSGRLWKRENMKVEGVI
jgi:hypothetical protein